MRSIMVPHACTQTEKNKYIHTVVNTRVHTHTYNYSQECRHTLSPPHIHTLFLSHTHKQSHPHTHTQHTPHTTHVSHTRARRLHVCVPARQPLSHWHRSVARRCPSPLALCRFALQASSYLQVRPSSPKCCQISTTSPLFLPVQICTLWRGIPDTSSTSGSLVREQQRVFQASTTKMSVSAELAETLFKLDNVAVLPFWLLMV